MTDENEKAPWEAPTPIEEYYTDTSGWHPGWLFELIQKRAYELFEQRSQLPGNDLDDWLRAEREVKHHFGIE